MLQTLPTSSSTFSLFSLSSFFLSASSSHCGNVLQVWRVFTCKKQGNHWFFFLLLSLLEENQKDAALCGVCDRIPRVSVWAFRIIRFGAANAWIKMCAPLWQSRCSTVMKKKKKRKTTRPHRHSVLKKNKKTKKHVHLATYFFVSVCEGAFQFKKNVKAFCKKTLITVAWVFGLEAV